MADIGKRIKERRESLKMTQEELAQKLGYKNKSTIGKIETGVNDIVQSKVPEFANALNTSVAYLMGWINSGDEDGLLDYFDATLDKAILFLKKNGYSVFQTDSSFDDTIVIRNKNNHLIKTMTEGELVGNYEKIKIHNLPRTVNNLLNINDFMLSSKEQDHIQKYRDLDLHGKEMVDFTLLKEWERSTAEAKTVEKVVPMAVREDATYVNAAHADDYASAPEELKQLEEDIMDDENF